MEITFIVLQVFISVFLLLHDWIPLGPFNDIAGVRSQNTLGQLLLATLINCAAIAVTLGLSLRFYRVSYPARMKVTLVGILSLLFVGELRAWWKSTRQTAQRQQLMKLRCTSLRLTCRKF